MSAQITEATELSLEAPETLRYGGEKVRCGGTTYRAVKHLLARPDGASLDGLCVAVWGDERVPNETVRSLIFRVNRTLEGLRCPRRVGLHGDRVTFE